MSFVVESEDIMFKYRVKFTDGNTVEVTSNRDTLILLETLIRYGIVKKITAKSENVVDGAATTY